MQQEYNYPIICSLHPRTRNKCSNMGWGWIMAQVRFLSLRIFDFVALERRLFALFRQRHRAGRMLYFPRA